MMFQVDGRKIHENLLRFRRDQEVLRPPLGFAPQSGIRRSRVRKTNTKYL